MQVGVEDSLFFQKLLDAATEFIAQERLEAEKATKILIDSNNVLNAEFPPIWDEEKLQAYRERLVDQVFGTTNCSVQKIQKEKQVREIKLIKPSLSRRSVGVNVNLIPKKINEDVKSRDATEAKSCVGNHKQLKIIKSNSTLNQFTPVPTEDIIFPMRLTVNNVAHEIKSTNDFPLYESTSINVTNESDERMNEIPNRKLEILKLPSVCIKGSLSLQEICKINILPADKSVDIRPKNILYCEVNDNNAKKNEEKKDIQPKNDSWCSVINYSRNQSTHVANNKRANAELYDDLYSVNNTILELMHILDNIDS